jgi:hypothetical protein
MVSLENDFSSGTGEQRADRIVVLDFRDEANEHKDLGRVLSVTLQM